MTILTVALKPGGVSFDGPGIYELAPLGYQRQAFRVSHDRGEVLVEAQDGRLMVGFGPSAGDVPPSQTFSTVFHQVGERFFPEVLVSVEGRVSVCPMARLHAEPR